MIMDSDSSHTIEVAIECPDWHSAVTDPSGIVRRAAEAALHEPALAATEPCEVSVLLADDARLHELNRTFRNQDKPTNVLSFPAGDDGMGGGDHVFLGDIAVALETVTREAAGEGKTIEAHLAHMIVHGTLHLLGLDHETAAEAVQMEAMEARILAGLGIADPYATEVAA